MCSGAQGQAESSYSRDRRRERGCRQDSRRQRVGMHGVVALAPLCAKRGLGPKSQLPQTTSASLSTFHVAPFFSELLAYLNRPFSLYQAGAWSPGGVARGCVAIEG